MKITINRFLFTGIFSAILVMGILSAYVSANAFAKIIEVPFDDYITSRNSALGQKGNNNNNEGEQGTGQAQSNGDNSSAQSVSPQSIGLTGNNINININDQ
ncbi:MAG: hypothetical protein AB7O87_06975 [Candidatus Nitrosocosmicus sp.]